MGGGFASWSLSNSRWCKFVTVMAMGKKEDIFHPIELQLYKVDEVDKYPPPPTFSVTPSALDLIMFDGLLVCGLIKTLYGDGFPLPYQENMGFA